MNITSRLSKEMDINHQKHSVKLPEFMGAFFTLLLSHDATVAATR